MVPDFIPTNEAFTNECVELSKRLISLLNLALAPAKVGTLLFLACSSNVVQNVRAEGQKEANCSQRLLRRMSFWTQCFLKIHTSDIAVHNHLLVEKNYHGITLVCTHNSEHQFFICRIQKNSDELMRVWASVVATIPISNVSDTLRWRSSTVSESMIWFSTHFFVSFLAVVRSQHFPVFALRLYRPCR